MRALVTGASGFIGSAVARALSRAGHEVHGLVRSHEAARALAAAEVHPLLGAMEEPASFREVAAMCEVAVHCAAEYSTRRTDLDRLTVETLLAGAPRLLVYTSGVWIYGDRPGELLDESSPVAPPPFIVPRVATEQRVLEARGVVIRPGCVYGGAGSLTAAWFASAVEEGAARIAGDGACHWAMVHVEDLAELYVRVAESAAGGEILNAGDRSHATVRECAAAASRAAGAGGAVRSVAVGELAKQVGPMAECLAYDVRLDSSKAGRLVGWAPRHAGFVAGAATCFAAWQALR